MGLRVRDPRSTPAAGGSQSQPPKVDCNPDCNAGGSRWISVPELATSSSPFKIRMDAHGHWDYHFLTSLNPKVHGSSPWAGTTSSARSSHKPLHAGPILNVRHNLVDFDNSLTTVGWIEAVREGSDSRL